MGHWAHLSDRGLAPHPLEDHLSNTSRLAGEFAAKFGCRTWGDLLGLWHDLGKYSDAFQAYLRAAADPDKPDPRRGSVDHATAGATHAENSLRDGNPAMARAMAFCLAGHHGGLPDWLNGSACLHDRLQTNRPETRSALAAAPAELRSAAPEPKPLPFTSSGRPHFQFAVLTRMLFSCLTDADFLDTEAYMAPEKTGHRQTPAHDWAALQSQLDAHLAQLQAGAPDTPVNRRRREVLSACRTRAADAPGFFSLTVPTGGGKTLSSLAFATRHARTHGLTRIIYAIPFTSIIEQNADVFRKALGPQADTAILEHHSNFDPRKETDWNRLATENWDAPIVVTTNVQLLESLFAAKTSRCRKLHNIVRSVIILDEAQTLPVELLKPSLAILDELVRNYGCTIVLCTATQPAIVKREDFDIGLSNVREIMDHPQDLYEALRRVTVHKRGKLEQQQLADELKDHRQVLCVVNSRKDAAELRTLLGKDDAHFHLSALMCPRHRFAVLDAIRRRLDADATCRVVSTQLIEAGVDVDFPVVYRALAGLDSLAQAAGRCNREGRNSRGEVMLYESENPSRIGHLRQTADTAREILPKFDDPLSPGALQRYFEMHYWQQKPLWDARGVMKCFKEEGSEFRTAADKYRIIREETTPVIVPFDDDARSLIEQLQSQEYPDRRNRRTLQAFSVSVYPNMLRELEAASAITWLHEQFCILTRTDFYSDDIGLSLTDDPMIV